MGRLDGFFLSEVLYKKIYNYKNEYIGRLLDIYVTFDGDYPLLMAYKVGRCGEIINYEFKTINFNGGNNRLTITVNGARDIKNRKFLYPLSKHLLDRQIVDVNGKKLVRVNDLRITKIAGEFRVIAIDTGITALGRRLGVDTLMRSLSKSLCKMPSAKLIMWHNVKSLEVINDYLMLSVPHKELITFQWADLDYILEEIRIKGQRDVINN